MSYQGESPPTRTALLDLRHRLREARHGFLLLERKREVLLRELWSLMRVVSHTDRDVRERFRLAYDAIARARLVMGDEGVGWAGLAPAARTRYTLEVRSVMGVALPQLNLQVEPLPLPYSPWGTSVAFDHARERWIAVGRVLGTWAETIGATWRVAAELERTARRVKALEHVLIPQYEADIRRIEHALEEQERESFVQAKRLKRQKEEAADA